MTDRPSLESMIAAMNKPRLKARAIKGADLASPEANEMAETYWRAEDREALIAARAEVAAFGAELVRIKSGGYFRRLWRALLGWR